MTPNERRAKSAHQALKDYRKGNDNQEAAIDLITDLFHWADKHQVNLEHCLEVARRHHSHESGKAKSPASPFPVGPHDRSWLG